MQPSGNSSARLRQKGTANTKLPRCLLHLRKRSLCLASHGHEALHTEENWFLIWEVNWKWRGWHFFLLLVQQKIYLEPKWINSIMVSLILQNEVINKVTDISIGVPSHFSQMERFFFPPISQNIYDMQNQAALIPYWALISSWWVCPQCATSNSWSEGAVSICLHSAGHFNHPTISWLFSIHSTLSR